MLILVLQRKICLYMCMVYRLTAINQDCWFLYRLTSPHNVYPFFILFNKFGKKIFARNFAKSTTLKLIYILCKADNSTARKMRAVELNLFAF